MYQTIDFKISFDVTLIAITISRTEYLYLRNVDEDILIHYTMFKIDVMKYGSYK